MGALAKLTAFGVSHHLTPRKRTEHMIAYVTVGADDLALAKRFYAAFLPTLGYRPGEGRTV